MKKTIELPNLSPQDLAELFWDMDAGQQAIFFNHLGTLFVSTINALQPTPGSFFPIDWQMYMASKHENMLPLGLRVMEIIGQETSGQRLQPYIEKFQV